MQFKTHFSALLIVIALVITPVVVASVVENGLDVAARDAAEVPNFIVSEAEMRNWLATTDANLTFIGDPITDTISPRSAQNTIVTYCSTRVNSICGGQCTVYNGGAACLKAPNTQCLSATHNVAFCAGSSCGGGCNPLATCGTKLDNGFCWTPNTNSIAVSTA